MGMGEPLANYDNVIEAARRIHDELGVGARHITISTVGIVPNIKRYADEERSGGQPLPERDRERAIVEGRLQKHGVAKAQLAVRRRGRQLQAHRQELVAHLAADALVPQGPGRLARLGHGAAM